MNPSGRKILNVIGKTKVDPSNSQLFSYTDNGKFKEFIIKHSVLCDHFNKVSGPSCSNAG